MYKGVLYEVEVEEVGGAYSTPVAAAPVAAPVAAPAPVPAEAPEKPTAPGSAGQVKLNNVAPKTAAMLMAIVANQIGKPLNELRFISIKELE